MIINPFISSSTLGIGLYAYYNADGNAYDGVSHDGDGTMVNGADFAAGKIGQAFNFDGINQHADLPVNFLNFLGDFSFSVWVYRSVAQNSVIVNSVGYDVIEKGFYLYCSSTGNINFSVFNSDTYIPLVVPSYSLPDNEWTNIVVTRKAGVRSTVYVNGVLKAQDSNPINPDYLPLNYCSIGSWKYNAVTSVYYFGGKVDDIPFWTKELTQAEVTENYNLGNGKQAPFL